jgi:hypothetical protein
MAKCPKCLDIECIARIDEISEAVGRSAWMAPNRKAFLSERLPILDALGARMSRSGQSTGKISPANNQLIRREHAYSSGYLT